LKRHTGVQEDKRGSSQKKLSPIILRRILLPVLPGRYCEDEITIRIATIMNTKPQPGFVLNVNLEMNVPGQKKEEASKGMQDKTI